MQNLEPNKKQNQVRQRRNLLSKVNSLHRHHVSRKWLERVARPWLICGWNCKEWLTRCGCGSGSFLIWQVETLEWTQSSSLGSLTIL